MAQEDVLREKRAEDGERIVSALGTQLTAEFGRGFEKRNLFRMIRFAEVFPDGAIVSALRSQLGWTHWRQIIALDDPEAVRLARASLLTRQQPGSEQ